MNPTPKQPKRKLEILRNIDPRTADGGTDTSHMEYWGDKGSLTGLDAANAGKNVPILDSNKTYIANKPDSSDDWLDNALDTIRWGDYEENGLWSIGIVNRKDVKAAILKHDAAEKLKLLEDIRERAYHRSGFELQAHAPGVIVDPNAIKWAVFEKEIAQLRKEVE